MKLRELNEDRNEQITIRAKRNFIQDLVANLQKVLASTTPTTVTVPATTGSPAVPTAPANAAPTGETPEQKRIRLQKASQQNIDNTTRVAPAVNSLTPEQIRKQKQAQAAQAARTGMPTRENIQFARLNALFESILHVDEAAPATETTATLSPSDLVTTSFIKHMNAPHIFGPSNAETLGKVKEFANEIATTYPVDGGKAAMEKMGEWAWDTMTEFKQRRMSSKWGANPKATPPVAPEATPPVAPDTGTPPATPGVEPPATPEADKKSKIGVGQINKIISTLDKRGLTSIKKTISSELAKRGITTGTAPAVAPEAPTNAGNSAFGQMANQLSGANKNTSSTGGTTTQTPTGLVHTAKPKVVKPRAARPAKAKPAKDNIISMPKNKTGKVRASREGGVTPEEQANFDRKVQQAMANQK